ncbi:hypothetical protein Scep_021754 [Stephania cephalantha]|uniref:Uncharacterized protein n=1 Tax=Stephania cephalantha TaxID=152367 RepID=A0AAP0I1Q3_9MAGN
MARRPPDRIPIDGDLDGQPQIGGGGGRTPAVLPYFRWDPSINEAIVRAAYDTKGCVRYGALMHEFCTLGVRPNFVTDEAWNRYRENWASVDFKARSEKASHNRKGEKGGPGTSLSKHTSGTRSFWTYEDILALDKDENDEVTPNDVFLHVHMKDQYGTKLVRSLEEHTQVTPDQPIDEEQLYYDAVGVCPKGRVYGLGSLATKNRRYADPGASTSQEPMVRCLKFDAVVQRLVRAEPIGNAHGLWCVHLSGTTTSGASSACWDRSGLFTTAAARR